jgi:hypothetical protein
MKKVALVLLVLACVSCEKPAEKRWEKFYGYTNADITGQYTNSYISDAFEDISESGYCTICDDADINIIANQGNTVSFCFKSVKGNLEKTLTGVPTLNNDDYLMQLYSSKTFLSSLKFYSFKLFSRVYHDKDQMVRLHGYVSKDFYVIENNGNGFTDTIADYSDVYYFDVIK